MTRIHVLLGNLSDVDDAVSVYERSNRARRQGDYELAFVASGTISQGFPTLTAALCYDHPHNRRYTRSFG